MAVACAALGSCVAVASAETPSGFGEVIDTQSNGTWTATNARLPASSPRSRDVDLDAVACAAMDSCVAVGSLNTQGLIETQSSPAITSASRATFTVGQPATFTLTAAGDPAPSITEKDKLPQGLHFVGGQGSATITGTPTASPGRFLVTIEASNGYRPNAVQYLTLMIER
jgi:hypothetical protein